MGESKDKVPPKENYNQNERQNKTKKVYELRYRSVRLKPNWNSYVTPEYSSPVFFDADPGWRLRVRMFTKWLMVSFINICRLSSFFLLLFVPWTNNFSGITCIQFRGSRCESSVRNKGFRAVKIYCVADTSLGFLRPNGL